MEWEYKTCLTNLKPKIFGAILEIEKLILIGKIRYVYFLMI